MDFYLHVPIKAIIHKDMLPITILLVFMKNLAFSSMQTAFSTEQVDDVSVLSNQIISYLQLTSSV
jgi:hypothetical protein